MGDDEPLTPLGPFGERERGKNSPESGTPLLPHSPFATRPSHSVSVSPTFGTATFVFDPPMAPTNLSAVWSMIGNVP